MYTRLAVTMLAARFSAAAIVAVAVAAAPAVALADDQGTADPYWTNVEASFANMLRHEPYYGATAVTVARGVKDPVETALHWREPGAARPAGAVAVDADPVRASFERMLNHAPYHGPTAVAVDLGAGDPVERIVFERLNDVRRPLRVAHC